MHSVIAHFHLINRRVLSKCYYIPIIVLTFYLCLTYQSIYGQGQIDTIVVDLEILSVDDGLSAGYVSDVALDTSGFLWMATAQGLNQYDGYKVKEYRHTPNDTASIQSNKVRALLVDSRGWLWVGQSPGLSLFDYRTESFINWDLGAIYDIKEDMWNNIWIKNFRDQDWILLTIDSNWNETSDLSTLKSHVHLVDKSDVYKGLPANHIINALLFSDKHGLLYQKNDTLFSYDLDYANKSAYLKFSKPLSPGLQNHKSCLFEDKKRDIIWFVDSEKYYSINPQNGETIHSHPFPDYIPKSNFDNQTIDQEGNIWIATSDSKIYTLSPIKNEFSILKKKGSENQEQATSIEVKDFVFDDHNNLWLPTNGIGVYKNNLNKKKFKEFLEPPYITKVSGSFLLPNNKIIIPPLYSCIDKEDIVSCLESGFKYKINAKHNYIMTLVDLEVNIYVFLASKNIENPDPDSLLIFDDLGNQLKKYSFEEIGFNMIFKISSRFFFNTENNICNIGSSTESRELVLHQWSYLDSNSMEVYTYPHRGDDLITGEIYKPYVADNGKIWIPTSTMGMYSWEPETETWDHFDHDSKNAASISSNQVFGFLSDPEYPDSILWVGTGDGLNKMNLTTNKFEVYKKEDGLPNNVIYGIQSDAYNNLWLSTNYGISRFNPTTSECLNFSVEDGLLHNEFNKEAQLKANNGIIYFGGMGGINYFDPEVFYEQYPSSPIKINGIRIDNERVEYSRNDNQSGAFNLSNPVEHLEEITIGHNERMITFEFALLDFTNPSENEYKYKLKGFNKNWIDAKNSNEATYTNLSPGIYTFQVIGKNANNTWNETPASIKLKVLPPYWKTWWFRLFLLLGIVGIVVLISKYRARQKEKMHNLRNRISQDLHDEIGSTLSSISLFGTVANKLVDQDQEGTKKMLTRINDSTTQVMESMNDIVWAINSENDKVGNLQKRMRAFVSELEEAADINISLDVDNSLKDTFINMVQRRNVYLIFKEATNNAFKYSKASEISITLKQSNNLYHLWIKDNGVGFDKENVNLETSLGGNGLGNMARRAEELDGNLEIISGKNQGTEIHFTWNPKSNHSLS